jgi:capsular exopolysaccharide synthesis family protein
VGDREAFHLLRANLRYFNFDEQVRSVVVTSTAPAEGKSTIAWNLTAAAATAGTKSLLIEAELRRPTLVREFHLADTDGLTEVLAGEADLWASVQQLPVAPASDGGADVLRTMDVLVAGRVPPNPTDLLESNRMRQIIEEAEGAYSLVVIDAPPVPVVSDAIPLMRAAGGVLVVVRLGQTTRDAANHLRRQLEGLNARVLGAVINGIQRQDGYYGSAQTYAEQYDGARVSQV